MKFWNKLSATLKQKDFNAHGIKKLREVFAPIMPPGCCAFLRIICSR